MSRLRMSTVLLVVLVLASTCYAETVVEGWRSPTGMFKTPIYTSVNPSDGSCWVTDQGDGPNTGEVVHLAEDGTELWRGGGFYEPKQVSVNPTDGSCWVADYWNHQIVHLAEDGTELLRLGGFYRPFGVAVDPVDGSCWVANTESSQIVHLAEDGTELLRLGGFNRPYGVAVNPLDGSCWVADRYQYQIVHLAPDGTELWRGGSFNEPTDLSYNHVDDSVWFTTYHSDVFHMASDGTVLNTVSAFRSWGISVNPTDGSCWVSNHGDAGGGTEVIHASADGTELWRGGGFSGPRGVSVNPDDGSCWVADMYNGQVVHLYTDPPKKDASKVLFTACAYGRPFGPGLFVADGDFSNPVRLTWPLQGEAALPECYCPGCDVGTVSADGTTIAVSRNGRLAMLDLTTLMYHPTQSPEWLLNESEEQIWGSNPTWSPDGTRVAFVGSYEGTFGICVVNADGTDQRLLFAATEPTCIYASWSPDGSRIAFQQGESNNELGWLWVLEDIDEPGGPTARQLTSSYAYSDETPVWSPDGTRIVFTRGPRTEPSDGPAANLWIVDVDSGDAYQLTDAPGAEFCVGWSPFDGRIYFNNLDAVDAGQDSYRRLFSFSALCSIRPDGTGYEVMNGSRGMFPWWARWLPTGAWIDGRNALPGESVAPRVGLADAENLAGVQARVSYTGCCNTLSMYGIGLGESILDWVMPSPSIGANSATMLAYAADPATDSASGALHLFDLGVTNDPAAQPGDTQLLAFDELLLADDWGDPIDRIALNGGVTTIPFACLEVAEITGPAGADLDCPLPFPVTITALDREGAGMTDCNVAVELGGYRMWDGGILMLDPVTPSSVTLVNGTWSGDVTLAEPRCEMQLVAHWEDVGGCSNWLRAISKGDLNADCSIDVFDVIKIANMAIDRGTWEPWQWWAADLNCDGEVDIFDVIEAANAAMAGMESMGIGRAGAPPVVAPPSEPVIVTTDVSTSGSQVVVAVSLSHCAGLAGVQVELDYDAKKLAYSGVSAGELLTGASSWSVMGNDLGGRVKAIAYTPSAEVLSGGDGIILTFTFSQTGKGKAKVNLTSVELADVEGGEIPSQMSAGKGGGKGRNK